MSKLHIKADLNKHKINKNDKEVKKISEQFVFEQLEKEAKTVFNRVNKRIRTLERNQYKVISPAYNALKEKRGNAPRFGLKGSYKDLKTLKKEYAQAVAFDNLDTSTYKGAKAYTDNLKNQFKGKISNDGISTIFTALHGLHERLPQYLYGNLLQYGKYLETVIEIAEDNNLQYIGNTEDEVEQIINRAINKLQNDIANKSNQYIDFLSDKYNPFF